MKIKPVIFKFVTYPQDDAHVFVSFMQMTSTLLTKSNYVQKTFDRTSKEPVNGVKLN